MIWYQRDWVRVLESGLESQRKDQVPLGRVGVPPWVYQRDCRSDLKYIALSKMLFGFAFIFYLFYFFLLVIYCLLYIVWQCLYVKHFESALCMKSAIWIKLPCLALTWDLTWDSAERMLESERSDVASGRGISLGGTKMPFVILKEFLTCMRRSRRRTQKGSNFFDILNWTLSFLNRYTFWTGLILWGGAVFRTIDVLCPLAFWLNGEEGGCVACLKENLFFKRSPITSAQLCRMGGVSEIPSTICNMCVRGLGKVRLSQKGF